MNDLIEKAREIVDECVTRKNCKICPFAENGIYCIIGQPVNWKLTENMETEGFWDEPEEEEEIDDE